MGCVSSSFLEDDAGNATAPGFGHHIVSLTSTTYGLLTTLDHPSPLPAPPRPPPPPPPPPPFLSTTRSPLKPRSGPEVINSWELMAGLDPSTPAKTPVKPPKLSGKENAQRALLFSPAVSRPPRRSNVSLEMFERRCPPGGEHAVVLYTTTLRAVRKTFEDCVAVRAVLEGLGVRVRERDVSMDAGFREELRGLVGGVGGAVAAVPPRLFVRGRYVGGAEEVLRIHEEGGLVRLLDGLPRAHCCGGLCDGCGGARFLPCHRCGGGRKLVAPAAEGGGEKGGGEEKKWKIVRCPECNENGLVLCPICS